MVIIEVTEEQYDAFCKLLERPPRVLPKLAELLSAAHDEVFGGEKPVGVEPAEPTLWCEGCAEAKHDVALVPDPKGRRGLRDKKLHLWLCEACFDKQVEEAKKAEKVPVAQCSVCHKEGSDVDYVRDPYEWEIRDNEVYRWLCDGCYNQIRADI